MTLNGEVAKLFSVILRNLVVSGANCVKVVDKTINMDNLRILCLVVNVCRGTRDATGILYNSEVEIL